MLLQSVYYVFLKTSSYKYNSKHLDDSIKIKIEKLDSVKDNFVMSIEDVNKAIKKYEKNGYIEKYEVKETYTKSTETYGNRYLPVI